jgi:phosphatidylinositol-4,5-bisphosphate 3-kinase
MATNEVLTEQCPPEWDALVKKQIQNIKQLIDSTSKWLFLSDEACDYRKRRIPSYLLQKDTGKYPCFVNQSNLSKAFLTRSSIELHVDLSNYANKIHSEKFK